MVECGAANCRLRTQINFDDLYPKTMKDLDVLKDKVQHARTHSPIRSCSPAEGMTRPAVTAALAMHRSDGVTGAQLHVLQELAKHAAVIQTAYLYYVVTGSHGAPAPVDLLLSAHIHLCRGGGRCTNRRLPHIGSMRRRSRGIRHGAKPLSVACFALQATWAKPPRPSAHVALPRRDG